MYECVEKPTQMSSDQVENLVKKALSFSDDNPALRKQIKKQRIFVFSICIVISCMENLFLYSKGIMKENLLVIDLMGLFFGTYFLLLAKEKLPTYYDENNITSYSDGIFRMNVPGLAFNNSNWSYILNVGRIWTMAVLIGYPIIYGVFSLVFPTIWNTLEIYVTLIIVLGGLFIPLYAIGKKYE